MKKYFALALFPIVGMAIANCSSDSDDPAGNDPSDQDNPAVLSGVFLDSAVAGLTYETPTQNGLTDLEGTYNYIAGEQIIFSIGATQLPQTVADSVLTPRELAVGSSDPSLVTTNIARLLQSLDSDGNADNGIDIPVGAADVAGPIDFDVSEDEFANDPAVINLVANSGSQTTALIPVDQANNHLNETLAELAGGNESGESEGEIILDLRGTTWLESNETGCDGLVNTVRVEFSQTGLSAFISRAEDRGQGCVREMPNFPETTYADANNTSAFILTCGGDGLCTTEELNREVLVPVGDPRNDCTRDGEAVEVNNRVSHEVGSDTITVFNCDPEDADVYVRQ